MKRIMATTALAALIFTGCGTGPDNTEAPYNPVDESWKAVENFIFAWNTRDQDLLSETLSDDFEMPLSEEDWADYNGDGIIDKSLPENIYLNVASVIFSSYSHVELLVDYSAGQSNEFTGDWNMKVYNIEGGEQTGWSASGETVIVCAENGSGQWNVISVTEIPAPPEE
ncbi:hypothetical protein CSA37_03270 [Candidatus Fermentibacteria bacterium]|nr:MAG: hypothetical protein CSA37_03270 [Candidatus Fermentibacteria bacterium]